MNTYIPQKHRDYWKKKFYGAVYGNYRAKLVIELALGNLYNCGRLLYPKALIKFP